MCVSVSVSDLPPPTSHLPPQKKIHGRRFFFFSGRLSSECMSGGMQQHHRAARRPSPTSVADLFANGLLTLEDVLPGGYVIETARVRAEAQYADVLMRRPQTAHAVPSARPGRPVPAPPATPPSLAHASPRAPPVMSPSRPSTGGARGTTSHVQRVRLRKTLTGDEERNRLPRALVWDTCCVCYSRERDHASDPCFHLCVCETCSRRLDYCPICRAQSVRFRKIYVA